MTLDKANMKSAKKSLLNYPIRKQQSSENTVWQILRRFNGEARKGKIGAALRTDD